ncbi:ATP-binding protein [Prochlorococcus marinus XMU1419]|uniref:ATP-binding protein n=1 Tax=Prochlorococcus marinus TaxID=1219 RepID=UPI001ADAA604|nr:ATP-binding protein [Prochlorococcus marinus]MBO8233285.1 ATP-binding protein [Prochlorococcus marinus XMU1419]MBW3076765.1 hypothetical protein [Prochlorococcus marinus str. XMU1419]
MTNASELIDATPSAALLIESIRDIGYSIETAISDLIDNSISANANNIYINLNDDDVENIFLEIVDDGHGMNRNELIKAMTIGAKDPRIIRDKDDLGRFGLGLKTASFSQCRKLTVESNFNDEINSFTWDLDLVREKNNWVVIDNKKDNLAPGTKIIWEKIDRADFKLSKINTNSILKNIDNHLGLVFHRFLEGINLKSEKLKIFINGSEVEPINPFNEESNATLKSAVSTFKYNNSNIYVQYFILPHEDMVTMEEWKKFEMDGGYIKNQGCYVYRCNRLIVSSTWFGIMPKLATTKLCRAKIDIGNDIDSDWKIDIKKSTAYPPKSIKNFLSELIINNIESKGRNVVNKRTQELIKDKDMKLWVPIRTKRKITYKINRKHPLVKKLLNNKENLLILKLLENSIPYQEIYGEMCDNSATVIGWLEEDKNVLNDVKQLIEIFRSDNVPEEIIKSEVEYILIRSGIQFNEESFLEILK